MNETTANRKRSYELDVMRIILMIFVIVGHSRYLNYVPYEFENMSESYNSGLLKFVGMLPGFAYSFHMPLFFVLSGMVAFITREKTFASFDKLVINKTKRLLIPYFICGFFWMIPLRILAEAINASNISDAITKLCNFTDTSHLWFLPVLFGVFICFYPFYLIYKKTKSITFTFISCYLFTILIGLVPISFLNFAKIVMYLPYFAAGFLAGGLIYNDKPKIKTTGFFKLSVSLSLAIILFIAQRRYALKIVPLNVLVMGVSIYLFSLFITEHTKFTSSKAFDTVNRHCMGIYLFHDPLNFAVLYLAHITGFLSCSWGGWLMFLLRTVGIAVVSLLLSVITGRLKKIILNDSKKTFIPVASIILAASILFVPDIISYSVNQLENVTDVNWTNGVRNNGTQLLLKNDRINHRKYVDKTPLQLCIGGEYYNVTAVTEDTNGYIRIEMESNEAAQKFAYPAKYSIIYEKE